MKNTKTDPNKTAAKLDDMDMLRVQNIQLRQQLQTQAQTELTKELQALSADIGSKYGSQDERI